MAGVLIREDTPMQRENGSEGEKGGQEGLSENPFTQPENHLNTHPSVPKRESSPFDNESYSYACSVFRTQMLMEPEFPQL